jgi:hypothetical protein
VYCETLKNLRKAIQNKRHGLLAPGVMFLHDNAGPHTATRSPTLLEHFFWELFDHHSYSPDLAPSYYHIFTYLKSWLGSKHFNNDEELMDGVKTWLSSQVADYSGRHIKIYSSINVPQFRQ